MLASSSPSVLLLLSAIITSVVADIPVHCTQPEVLGLWRLHVGEYRDERGRADPHCGGHSPDGVDDKRERTPPKRLEEDGEAGANGKYWLSDKFVEQTTFDVLLKDWTAEAVTSPAPGSTRSLGFAQKIGNFTATMPKGMWTTVYDEGFNIGLKGEAGDAHSMFAFFKYVLQRGEDATSTDNIVNAPHSHCGFTLLGWYNYMPDPMHAKRQERLCFWGEAVQSLHDYLGKGSGLRNLLKLGSKISVVKSAIGMMTSKLGMVQEQAVVEKSTPAGTHGRISRASSLHSSSFADSTDAKLGGSTGPKAMSMANTSTNITANMGSWVDLGTISGATSVHDYSAKLEQAIEQAKTRGLTVRFGHDKAKFKAWLQSLKTDPISRVAPHAVEGTEPSTIEELLDRTGNGPLAYMTPGFSSQEIIGPVLQVAKNEQQLRATELKKSVQDLKLDDMRESLGHSTTNHHNVRKFWLGGQGLDDDDWQSLKNFDWRHVSLEDERGTLTGFVPDVPDQGRCGSCYAMASTSMMTSRLMLRYPDLRRKWMRDGDRISWHQHMFCNTYCQGCSGGYPYLISRFGNENDLITTKCEAPFQKPLPREDKESYRQECEADEFRTLSQECRDERFRVQTWRYVGGALGRCGMYNLCEQALMEELYKGGPLVASVEPDAAYWYYNEGNFHPVEQWPASYTQLPDTFKQNFRSKAANLSDTQGFTWRKIDHSMLLVGWGEVEECSAANRGAREKGGNPSLHENECHGLAADVCSRQAACQFGPWKYWVLQNSWNTNWGLQGYMNLGPRGENPLFVETMAVAADIVRSDELTDGNPAEGSGQRKETKDVQQQRHGPLDINMHGQVSLLKHSRVKHQLPRHLGGL